MIFKRKYKQVEIAPDEILLDIRNIPNFNTHQFEGRIEQPIKNKTLLLAGVFFTILCGIALYKAVNLQIVRGATFAKKSELNRLRAQPVFANRGIIYDRNGVIIASNTLASSTATSTFQNEPPKRVYADYLGLSHVLGYVSYPKKDASGNYWQDEFIGMDGIEKQYDSVLRGVKGTRVVEVDATGEPLATNITQVPQDGTNITLAIDAKLQDEIYRLLELASHESGFTGGAAAIMDIQTGEMLALVSYPEFDIQTIETDAGKKAYQEALLSKKKPFLDRVVSGLYAPGSTVKPFMALAALTENIIDPNKQIESKGFISIPNPYGGAPTVFRDWKVNGWTDMRRAIAVSSDVYFYSVGGGYLDQKGLGIDRIYKYMTTYGFASKTGIDLPKETSGVVPSQDWKKKIFNEDWLLGDTYHTSIGQYGFQITPIELLRAVAALANGGKLLTPTVQALYEGQKPMVQSTLAISDQDLKVIQEGMRQTVTVGSTQTLQEAGFPVAAKSGTAEIGVAKGKVNSWMTGFFPYPNPQFAFVVVLENGPDHVTRGAGRTATDILRWIYNHTPEYAGLPKKDDTQQALPPEATDTEEVIEIPAL